MMKPEYALQHNDCHWKLQPNKFHVMTGNAVRSFCAAEVYTKLFNSVLSIFPNVEFDWLDNFAFSQIIQAIKLDYVLYVCTNSH